MRISDWSSDVCSSDLLDKLAHGLIDAFGGGFAIAALEHSRHRRVSKKAMRLVLVGDLAKTLPHAEARDHAPSNVRRLDEIVGSPCRHLVEYNALRRPAAAQDGPAVFDLGARHELGSASCRERVW